MHDSLLPFSSQTVHLDIVRVVSSGHKTASASRVLHVIKPNQAHYMLWTESKVRVMKHRFGCSVVVMISI